MSPGVAGGVECAASDHGATCALGPSRPRRRFPGRSPIRRRHRRRQASTAAGPVARAAEGAPGAARTDGLARRAAAAAVADRHLRRLRSRPERRRAAPARDARRFGRRSKVHRDDPSPRLSPDLDDRPGAGTRPSARPARFRVGVARTRERTVGRRRGAAADRARALECGAGFPCISAGMCAAILAVGAWFAGSRSPSAAPLMATFDVDVPAGWSIRAGDHLAVSPDGRYLAFTAADRDAKQPALAARPECSRAASGRRHLRRAGAVLVARRNSDRVLRRRPAEGRDARRLRACACSR